VNRSTYPLKLPASVKRAAQRLAKEDGVSLNQWIAVAVAQKVGVSETAAEFFAGRGAGAQPGELLAVLRKAPNAPPDEEDRLPVRGPKRRGSR
jgi:hypothetical protein